MRRIRSRDTKPELAMRSILVNAGLGFTDHPELFGKPDFLVGRTVAVFVDSGFWHGRHWNALKEELERGSRANYWVDHIERNRGRDRRVNAGLRAQGYVVLRFWDATVYRDQKRCLSKIKNAVEDETSRLAPMSQVG